MDIKKLLEKIDLEIDSTNAGHQAYRDSQNFKNFNHSVLENTLFSDGDEDIEMTTIDDSNSTFDEANYSLGSEEYYEDN
tara:strand:+ start:1692 stop:1928 length:237 start_codon:yes stop_codon:yes gene_type:complete